VEITFRTYNKQDAEAVAAVFRESIRGVGVEQYTEEQVRVWSSFPYDMDEFRERLSEGLTLLAGDNHRIVAFGQLSPKDHVEFMYTVKSHSRAGVATAIYCRLERRAVEEKVTILHTEASRIARSFFLKQGFTSDEPETVFREGVAFERFKMSKALG
jgi:putative acetyltransferase